ncbi:hypothetical protein RHGRI_008309 [Rhododendron griersonianum]|uniref:Aminotransferase class I/classII large domain-containing protein n=1 Tax=Rhododendron griersonianum TaxID=479676 RepID=A0AAV6L038_9ERIC|nr:hypothetical protein RHGRI_008309 [Rhododendron griersonianum]
MEMRLWDHCVEEALSKLESLKLIRSLRPIHLPSDERRRSIEMEQEFGLNSDEFEVFDGLQEWDRASVEVEMAESTFQRWAALAHGMGPKGSALICGYTNYHRLLESCLADLKSKEAVVSTLWCSLEANMALMTTLGSVGSLLAAGGKPLKDDRVAIFSDSLNHASIIDGIRLAERQGSVVAFVYRHCDMSHLNALLLRCPMKKKVVVTDSLFSMDGDFAPMGELSKLRKRHGFLLVIDDAHGMFVCGKNGGGVAEEFNCESDVDICVAAVIVAQKETWRRRAIWKRVQDFHALTGLPVTSPIISLVVGSEEKALQASWYLLKSGFHVTAIRPPTVPPNSCRLRVTLSAAHTLDDLKKFTAALSECINFRDMSVRSTNGHARL